MQLVIERVVGNFKLFRSCRYQEGHDGQELEADEWSVVTIKKQFLGAEATIFSARFG